MEEEELRTALTHWLLCKKDFGVFKKGEYYWLELLMNGNLCGRSDNVKEVEINDFPYDQFYDIFYLSVERV
jgi:hypothetical protein